MANYRDVLGSYLKTEDLNGKAHTVILESVTLKDLKDSQTGENKSKLVAKFKGSPKTMILNGTNLDALAAIFKTNDYELWSGKRIVLFPTTTRFGNKTVPCMRIRKVQAQQPQPVTPTAPAPLPVQAPEPDETEFEGDEPDDDVFTPDDDDEAPF